jgi:hypothetical protein
MSNQVLADPLTLPSLTIFGIYLGSCLTLSVYLILKLYYAHSAGFVALNAQSKSVLSRQGIFAALAASSLAVTWWHMISFFSFSYSQWQQGQTKVQESSTTLVHTISNFSIWLEQTQLFREAWEAAMVSNARYFWSQPIFFIAAIWSVMLSREKISKSGVYMVLGQAVAISFAMNLSFVAMLQNEDIGGATTQATASARAPSSTAVNEADADEGVSKKPLASEVPSASKESSLAFMLFLVPVYICVTLFQQSTGTKWFMPLLAVPHIMLLLLPIVRRSSNSLQTLRIKDIKFTWIVIMGASLLLQSRVTYKALHETTWSGIFSAFGEHPAVSSVGSDTLMSAFSLAVWAWCQA